MTCIHTSRTVVTGGKNPKLANTACYTLKRCPHAKSHAENKSADYDDVVEPDGQRPAVLPSIPAPAWFHIADSEATLHNFRSTDHVATTESTAAAGTKEREMQKLFSLNTVFHSPGSAIT